MSCSLTMSADNSSLEAMMALGQWANIGTPNEVYLHSSEMAVEEINIEFTIGDEVQTATLPVSIEAGTITKVELPFAVNGPAHTYQPYIHQPGDDRYKQFNNYGNNAYGEFYGYEKYPSWIPSEEMWYQEVVRFITDMNGTPGSLPATPTLNETYEYTVDMDIPANILNGENACYIGMLIDATTQEILNCAEISADEVDRGSEVPLFYDGFRYGLIGKNYVRYDLDGNKPFSSINLEIGDAWGIDQEDGDYYAFSTSYYSPGGTSDDWLITPEVNVADIDGLTLSWRARSSSSKYKDGYEVLISTTGSDTDDFTPLQTIAKEEAAWTDRQWDGRRYLTKQEPDRLAAHLLPVCRYAAGTGTEQRRG